MIFLWIYVIVAVVSTIPFGVAVRNNWLEEFGDIDRCEDLLIAAFAMFLGVFWPIVVVSNLVSRLIAPRK